MSENQLREKAARVRPMIEALHWRSQLMMQLAAMAEPISIRFRVPESATLRGLSYMMSALQIEREHRKSTAWSKKILHF